MRVVINAMTALLCVACGQQDRQAAPVSSGRLATTVCIENRSSVTPVVTFIDKDEQSGEGSLEFGAKACASGLGSETDVYGRIGLPVPNAPMEFWAYNADVGLPGAGLNQEGAGYCSSELFALGESQIWDDGLARYVIKREPDGVRKNFLLTIRDSESPSADGKPRPCPMYDF